jgi:hypothetical protein
LAELTTVIKRLQDDLPAKATSRTPKKLVEETRAQLDAEVTKGSAVSEEIKRFSLSN